MMTKVYRYTALSKTDLSRVSATGEATLAAIKMFGDGEPILGSEREVDERVLDPHGVVHRCPTCSAALSVVEASVRAGSGLDENSGWRSYDVLECPTHGQWHRQEGKGVLSKI